MFATHELLRKKTPEKGIGRKEFIEHLVEEFHTTTNIEAQEQVTANLANFAYDPINYKFLRDSAAADVFLQILVLPNERLALHGIAGLCNICLDRDSRLKITTERNFYLITNLFTETKNSDIALNCITLFYLLLSEHIDKDSKLKRLICCPGVIKQINYWKQQQTDLRIRNISTIFIEDFATRTEIVEKPDT